MFKNTADIHGYADFLVYENERYSFEKSYPLATSFCEVLKDEYKIEKGDKVVIPMKDWWSQQELLHVLKHSKALWVISDDKGYIILQGALEQLNMPCLIARSDQQQGNDLGIMCIIENNIKLTPKITVKASPLLTSQKI